MEKNYIYPRVSINTTALTRSSVGPEAEDTTVLFAPIIADRGPDNKIVVCHTLSEFIDVFGDLSYEANKLQAFNVYNWLSNGGTIYARRLMFSGAAKATVKKDNKTIFEAKFPGQWYNTIKIVIEGVKNLAGYYNITIQRDSVILETYYRIKSGNIKTALAASNFVELVGSETDALSLTSTPTLDDGSDGEKVTTGQTLVQNLDDLVREYFTAKASAEGSSVMISEAEKDLGNTLETPIDLILDACFSSATKALIYNFVAGSNAVRPDIIVLFDRAESYTDKTTGEEKFKYCTNFEDTANRSKNIAVFSQYFVIYDAIFSDKNVTVGPTYFLSKLIPFNDLQYGIQFPTAGLRRGVLADAISVNENPRPDDKNDLFRKRINYVEKTSREYAFMSQRTHDNSTEVSYDALSFLNNARCLEKMKKELERLGRDYLFEFNDSVTLAQLSNILNKYMAGWVSNRTLSFADVKVEKDLYSSEKVNITLRVRFTGTIEVISVDIVIE